MNGIIRKVNYSRSLAIFEDDIGDFGYFEMLDKDSFEEDDEIIGNLHNLGDEVIVKIATGERYSVCIEDFGMSLESAIKQCF